MRKKDVTNNNKAWEGFRAGNGEGITYGRVHCIQDAENRTGVSLINGNPLKVVPVPCLEDQCLLNALQSPYGASALGGCWDSYYGFMEMGQVHGVRDSLNLDQYLAHHSAYVALAPPVAWMPQSNHGNEKQSWKDGVNILSPFRPL